MFRVKIYLNDRFHPLAVGLTSDVVWTEKQAEDLLENLATMLGDKMTGGEVETEVPNVGWCTPVEAESIQIIGRTREPVAYPE